MFKKIGVIYKESLSFDKDILSELPVENVLHNSNNLLHFFRDKYQRNDNSITK